MAVIFVDQAYGFAVSDSTTFVQAALDGNWNNTGNTLVFRDMGSPWLISSPRTRNNITNLTIVFADGCEVYAKAGSGYNGVRNDRLFQFGNANNLTILGYGATLGLDKHFYYWGGVGDDGDGEHSHIFNIVPVSDQGGDSITIKGIYFDESGGDAVRADEVSNFTMEDCHTWEMTRQGISIITSTGGTNVIRGCIFENTSYRPPQAGIDWEPNDTVRDVAVGIDGTWLVEHCSMLNNWGWAATLTTFTMDSTSPDVDITIQDCYATGNMSSADDYNSNSAGSWNPGGSEGTAGHSGQNGESPGGNFRLKRLISDTCPKSFFASTAWGGLEGYVTTVDDMVGWNTSTDSTYQSVRWVCGSGSGSDGVGNTTINSMLVKAGGNDFATAVRSVSASRPMQDITGTIHVIQDTTINTTDATKQSLSNQGVTISPAANNGLSGNNYYKIWEDAGRATGAKDDVTLAINHMQTSAGDGNDFPVDEVEVTATVTQSVRGGTDGQFTFTRNNSRAWPIFVKFSLTLNSGLRDRFDYRHIPQGVVIPANETSATVDVVSRVVTETNDIATFGNTLPQGSKDLDLQIVQTNPTGLYTIGASSSATVTIVDSGAPNTKPVITLTGQSVVNVTQGDPYVDAGATATDAEDGDLTGSIVTGGDIVDTNVQATYVITYDVTDSGGLAADQVTRTVIVSSSAPVPRPTRRGARAGSTQIVARKAGSTPIYGKYIP